MVKGISRQVIVVRAPDQKLFDQAIFILKDEAVEKGVTDEMLLSSANKLFQSAKTHKIPTIARYGAVWAFGGALVTGLVWLLTTLL